VILTLVTEWCHWCHVMDEKTWGDPAFAALMAERFVVVRVDADSRPDLAERYADWGWPALALLTPSAEPVTEWRGYQEARRFERELRAYVADFDAGKPLARKASTSTAEAQPLQAMRDFTKAQLDGFYDDKIGGWGQKQKYPLWAPVAHELLLAREDQSAAALARVRQTLDGELALIDRVDGGMFQYSVDGRWDDPHFEKLAEINGAALENYADAYAATGDERYAAAGRDLARYALTILRRDDGGFFANQDADVGTRGEVSRVLGRDYYALPSRAARAAKGTPFIDRHVYASHNGRLIAGLARFGAVVDDRAIVDAAVAAAAVVDARHAVADGYSHDEGVADDAVLHLADQVAMGRAHHLLGEATGDARHRAAALRIARFIVARFEDKAGGFVGAVDNGAAGVDVGVFGDRRKPFRANGEAARLLIAVGRHAEDAGLVAAGERALAALSSPAVIADEYRMVGEVLLAVEELLREPLHFAVVGDLADAASAPGVRALLAAVHRAGAPHRLVDVQRPGEKYPDLKKPALYICGTSFCSAPITDPKKVAAATADFLAK
jgi:uncharacterized protein YyaL (SSP411 family)